MRSTIRRAALQRLALAALLCGPAGRRGAPVSMTVDGQPVAIRPGQYRRHIVLGLDAR